MTDKQIIIDGADVSKCKYFDCNYKECKAEYYVRHGYEIVKYDSCRENPNCYYKQLKRKEQECERLKEEVSLLKESNSKLQQIEDVNSLEKCYLQQLDKLKQTIAEIKEICNEYQKEYILNIGVEILTNKILQII